MGRLDRGVNLFEALLEVCSEHRVRTGEVRALGSLETVEVAEYDQAQKRWKPGRVFTGGMEILTLSGNVSERGGQLALHAHASLMRDRDNGVEILGGHVISGRVFALEFVIDAFDDIVLRRGHDAATGLTLWTESAVSAVPAPSPRAIPALAPAAPAPTGPVTWADVARVPEADDESEPESATSESLEPGDILIHPTFGRCEVQRIEGGGEFAHVRLKNSRLVRLSLDVLKIHAAGDENGRRVYRARVD